MSSSSPSTEQSSWSKVKGLLLQGVTSTTDLMSRTGLAKRTVQVLKKKWNDANAFVPHMKVKEDGSRIVYESPNVTCFLGPIGEN